MNETKLIEAECLDNELKKEVTQLANRWVSTINEVPMYRNVECVALETAIGVLKDEIGKYLGVNPDTVKAGRINRAATIATNWITVLEGLNPVESFGSEFDKQQVKLLNMAVNAIEEERVKKGYDMESQLMQLEVKLIGVKA